MVISDKVKDLLSSIYTTASNPASFSSAERLYRAARLKDKSIRLKDVREFLHQSNTYTLHFPSRRKHRTGRTRCTWIDSDHQADLGVFLDIKDHNSGYSYVLLVIDVLSRFIWCEKMKRKTGKECAEAYERILNTSKRVCFRLSTDEGENDLMVLIIFPGKEFLARDFQDVLKRFRIQHKIPKNHDVKCGVAGGRDFQDVLKRF